MNSKKNTNVTLAGNVSLPYKHYIPTFTQFIIDKKTTNANLIKLFTEDGSLKKHIRTIHEGHKDYKCESCGKSFSHANQLMRHIHGIHEDLIDYKCESCSKSFSYARHLKKHAQKTHEGQK